MTTFRSANYRIHCYHIEVALSHMKLEHRYNTYSLSTIPHPCQEFPGYTAQGFTVTILPVRDFEFESKNVPITTLHHTN